MAGTCGKDGRRQRSEAKAVWQTRRKKEERNTQVEVARRCGGELQRGKREEMED
jgi:hypothetical protein